MRFMCGIAGFLGPPNAAPGVLVGMTRTVAHRGPDAEGYFEASGAHLGHRRLSVLDIAGSPQPMRSPDGTLCVVFNGEIYNFTELRRELTDAGWHFTSAGDTEVLLAGWWLWGEALVTRLRGMFAFALWDATRGTLFIARDHLGVKPLYYALAGNTLVFGSELKTVMAHPAVAGDLDLHALRLYLECQFVPGPWSIRRGVRKLPPGHWLRLTGDTLDIQPYWRADYSRKLDVEPAAAADLLDVALCESVSRMLVADVPVGAFLSGGVDSSLVAALMTRLRGSPIDTFNIGFEGPVTVSEHREAARVAAHIGSRHHSVMLNSSDVLAGFDHWVDVFDEPFADQAALPTMLLAARAREHVTVVLTGEGADEVFGGYANYSKRIAEERWMRWLAARGSPLPSLVRTLPARWRKDRVLRSFTEPLARRYRTISSLFDATVQPSILSPGLLAATRAAADVGACAARLHGECNSAEYLDHLLHVDMGLWLPDDLLTKVDRATMAHSLEARVPYLDHRFVEFCARLPASLKIQGRTHKYLLKRVAEQYLPHSIVHRGKHGFVMPLSEWLAGRLAPEIRSNLLDGGLDRRGIFRSDFLARLVDEHCSERRNHAGRLWSLLILERWFRRYAPQWQMA
jgi:asparagine synthase (glutamine-hydrolysing)